jgi:hypothetical protein
MCPPFTSPASWECIESSRAGIAQRQCNTEDALDVLKVVRTVPERLKFVCSAVLVLNSICMGGKGEDNAGVGVG